MPKSFFFYDLETSGLNPREDRIMQFAGIRTDSQLKQIGEPYNVMVKLTDDVLPSPDAVMVTGITPQMTLTDGMSEKEFCDLLMKEIFTPDTITVGFNSVRFDDEFIRHTLWRNFFDPYEWAWADGRGRWDLLDAVRMTRALRPDGIKWPTIEGKPVNKLELITKENGIDHYKAHDALSDVEALIAVASLIKEHQPKLYDYLLSVRDKREVEKIVNLDDPKPFVYASGRYGSEHDFTTVALPVFPGTKPGSVVVYDLRFDPSQFSHLSQEELAKCLFSTKEERGDLPRIPAKELSFNKCPAVAPLGVLDEDAQKRLGITIETISSHVKHLKKEKDFLLRLREAYRERPEYQGSSDVESKLYDSFANKKDLPRMAAVRAADASSLADFHPEFIDERLSELLFRYKARQYPSSLSEEEQERWQAYRSEKISRNLPGYLKRLGELAQTAEDTFVLEELQLWAESIVPEAE